MYSQRRKPQFGLVVVSKSPNPNADTPWYIQTNRFYPDLWKERQGYFKGKSTNMEGVKSEQDGLKKAKNISPAPKVIIVQTFKKRDASDNYMKAAYELIGGVGGDYAYAEIDAARARQLWQAAL